MNNKLEWKKLKGLGGYYYAVHNGRTFKIRRGPDGWKATERYRETDCPIASLFAPISKTLKDAKSNCHYACFGELGDYGDGRSL